MINEYYEVKCTGSSDIFLEDLFDSKLISIDIASLLKFLILLNIYMKQKAFMNFIALGQRVVCRRLSKNSLFYVNSELKNDEKIQICNHI